VIEAVAVKPSVQRRAGLVSVARPLARSCTELGRWGWFSIDVATPSSDHSIPGRAISKYLDDPSVAAPRALLVFGPLAPPLSEPRTIDVR